MTIHSFPTATAGGHVLGPSAAIDLALAVLDQDGPAAAAVIRRLRATAQPDRQAHQCEQRLNQMLATALGRAGVRPADVEGTMPTDPLADCTALLLDLIQYPVETEYAVAALVHGDLGPLRRLHGTPGLLARAVTAVGLGLVVQSPTRLRRRLIAERSFLG
ncbi:hypothetical protein CFP65_6994 [Kitasatospora sp. MMS16-BH015]|uniref:hypothetical protein n=1 Tax=Kitasatospora sp. MMS16-BH015 TaxID=2018025 RepID=UPI000CA30581|nr:hypothetical protein [Kitasatospora sp. MMS16-BH015]AUG81606.1 hypothetical protein CFP65_6994 [Kitasatospora sp. MMS16-BH015]